MVQYHPPIITVKLPSVMMPPCTVVSPIRAAGCPPINTVADPLMILSGGPAQVRRSPILAAGIYSIITVGQPGGITGPPTWGAPPGFTIGQVCISPTLAAPGISSVYINNTTFDFCLSTAL